MKLQKILQFCAKIGFWPIGYGNDGKIRIAWLYMLNFIVGIILNALLIYRLLPLFTSISATPMAIGEIVFVIAPSTTYALQILIYLQHKRCGHIITASNININYWEVIGSVLLILVNGCFFLSMRYFLLCKIGFQQLDTLIVIGLVIVDSAMLTSGYLLIGIFVWKLENFVGGDLTREKFSIEKIHNHIKIINQTAGVISMIGWPCFVLSQVFIILAAFMVVSDFNYFYVTLFVFNLLLLLVVLIGKLEHCYDLIRDVALKIRNDSVEATTVKEMMKLQIAAMELENCCPFTCNKYFSLTRETLTAMVATTLTYLVVLIQFQQSA